jgi:hypothetical protein
MTDDRTPTAPPETLIPETPTPEPRDLRSRKRDRSAHRCSTWLHEDLLN